MEPVPAPQGDEREQRDYRSPAEIIKDITEIRLPSGAEVPA